VKDDVQPTISFDPKDGLGGSVSDPAIQNPGMGSILKQTAIDAAAPLFDHQHGLTRSEQAFLVLTQAKWLVIASSISP